MVCCILNPHLFQWASLLREIHVICNNCIIRYKSASEVRLLHLITVRFNKFQHFWRVELRNVEVGGQICLLCQNVTWKLFFGRWWHYFNQLVQIFKMYLRRVPKCKSWKYLVCVNTWCWHEQWGWFGLLGITYHRVNAHHMSQSCCLVHLKQISDIKAPTTCSVKQKSHYMRVNVS